MRSLLFSLLTTAALATSVSLSGCNTAPAAPPTATAVETSMLTLDLKAGQVLQFAFIKPRKGESAKQVRQRYFETAIPYAESLGDEYLGNLRVNATMLGKNKPQGVALYAFPDAAAQAKFQASPDWPDYQKMRVEGWEELHVFSTVIETDMVLDFDPAKDYTFAAAWTRPDTMTDYQRYLDGIENDFDQIGARYLAQLNGVTLQSHSDDGSDPSQLTIVEWSEGPNLKGLQSTDGYKANADSFQKAISRFDLYWLTVPEKN
jgi:uncharacterized protein (DUF1330 family)